MNSPSNNNKSPSFNFRNLKTRQKQSPVDIKEKLRKSYKEKIHNCRSLIFNSLRGNLAENRLQTTLNEIYKSMFNFENFTTEEEEQLLDEIKSDLVKEELHWWLEEYEKCHHIDWDSIEAEEVICPVCQKQNLYLSDAITVSCLLCQSNVKTQKSLSEIKKIIFNSIERHNNACRSEVLFTCVSETDDSHIYLICDTCNEMQEIF